MSIWTLVNTPPVSIAKAPKNSLTESIFASDIKPTSKVYLFIFSSNFLNKIISCLYSFTHSSLKQLRNSIFIAVFE